MHGWAADDTGDISIDVDGEDSMPTDQLVEEKSEDEVRRTSAANSPMKAIQLNQNPLGNIHDSVNQLKHHIEEPTSPNDDILNVDDSIERELAEYDESLGSNNIEDSDAVLKDEIAHRESAHNE